MNSPTDFFTKYPALNECWQSPDGQLHFNKTDADLHSRVRNIPEKSKKHVRGSADEPKIKKPNKTL